MRFTAKEVDQARTAVGLLLSPLSAESVDAWRSSVNGRLRELLSADSVGFILPGCGGPLIYSDEHSQKSLQQYPDLLPPLTPSGHTVFEQVIAMGVATLAEAYQGKPETYLESAYYREYAGANGAHDTLSGLCPLGGTRPREIGGLQFWHASPRGRPFGDREAELLRLVFPALRAGIEVQIRWMHHRASLLSILDELGAVLVVDQFDRAAHQTPALTAALSVDPAGERIRTAMAKMAEEVSSCLTDWKPLKSGAVMPRSRATLATAYATYRLSAFAYPDPATHSATLRIITLERLTPVLRSEQDLREVYRLSPAEYRVAGLLVRGAASNEIARELHLSPHTVRRHTERILTKVKVRSKTELVAKLLA